MSLFTFGRSAEQSATTATSSSSSSPASSTGSSDTAAPSAQPPSAHPPCTSYLSHIAAHGIHPTSVYMALPATCSRSSLHSSTSAADIRAAFTAIERLTVQHPHYVVGLADALQHDMSLVSAELHSQAQPPQQLSPFADYFLHTGFSQSVRLLLQRYVELTSMNATNSQSLVAIARGTGAKRTVHPFDLLRVYSALRDSVLFGCSVFGVVTGAVRAVIVDVWSMLFKWNDAWQRIHAGSWVSELAVHTRTEDKEEEEEEEEEEDDEEEEGTPPATTGSPAASALSAVSGEKHENAVMPTLVASTDAMSTLRSILVKRRSSTNKVPCDAAYEAEGESEEDIVSEESDNDAVYSDNDEDIDHPPRGMWEPETEPGADGYAADTAADVDMAKPAPSSPRTPPPPLTAPFSPAVSTGTPRPRSPTTATATTEQDKHQLLVELDQYGQYRDVAWWRRKVAGEEGWQINMPPGELPRESMAYPVVLEEEPAEEALDETTDTAMDDSAAASESSDQPSAAPSLPRRLRKLSHSSPPSTYHLPSFLVSDLPRSFSRWCASESDGLYYQELVNLFGLHGGFHLLLSALPAAPLTTYRFLICRPPAVADTIILTPAEQAALQQVTDRPSLMFVRDLLGLVHALVGKPAAGIQLRIVLLFVARVMAYSLSMTDAQLQRESKQQVSELVTLCTLLASQQSTLPLASHMERFESDFSLYLLRCASLEKRIHGLSHIKRLLEVEQERRLGLTPSHGAMLRPLMDHSSPPYSRPVASHFVLLPSYTRYLQKAAVIETLFGEGLHVQLLRRSMSLLRCMAQQQCVSAQQLDCMWAATRGKHETVAAQVYGCMTAVIPVLPMSGLQHLFDRLTAVSVSEIDVQFVALVRCIVAAAIELHMPTQHEHAYCRFDPTATTTDTDTLPARGLDFLWRLFNERHLPVDSLRHVVFEHLQALLLSDAACPFRRTYLLHCVDNVKRQWNVPHALWLLIDLCDTYQSKGVDTVHTPSTTSASAATSSAALPTSPFKQQLMVSGVAINSASAITSTPRHSGTRRTSGVDDRSAIIEYLNADNALLSAFFRELSAFAAQPSGVAGVFPAAKTFEMRLLFLDYVYRYCKTLTIDYPTVALLWSYFISPLSTTSSSSVEPPPSFDAECRDVLFGFLTSIFTTSSTHPSVCTLVFHQLVPLLPFTTLSPSGYLFFQLLFLFVNRSEGRIACHPSTPLTSISTPVASFTAPLTFTVRCAPSALSGFEYVWELACVCEVNEVGNEATRMLQRLHAQVEASGLSGLTESYERCASKAMERIVRVKAELEQASAERKGRLNMEMERCFNILNLLLDQPHYSHITSPTLSATHTATNSASVSPCSTPAAASSPSVVSGSSHLLAVPATQRCRPPHVCGGLSYLSQDYPPLPPTAPAAYPISITVNYPLSDMVMGQFDVRVSSHATMDELLIVIQQQSMTERALLDLATEELPPFPFTLIDLCEFGSEQSLTTRDNRRKRLGQLAPAPARQQGEEEVKWELKLRCKGETADCRFDPKHTCPSCHAALPLWVYHCRCGHDERSDSPPENQRIWSETKTLCHEWEKERRICQKMDPSNDSFPLSIWHNQTTPAYPLRMSSVWYRNEEMADWQDDEDVDMRDEFLPVLGPHKQAAYLAAMRGDKVDGAGARLIEERKASSGSGLKIVLRKDKDKEGEFSAGEMPTPAPADMDTEKQPTVEQSDVKPPAVTMSVVHPSVILSRVEYVPELFKLLAMSGSDTQLSEKCWQLLMRLDINAQLLHRLHTLDEQHTDWSTLLDGRNVAKLQYSLIIVRLLMQGHAYSVSAVSSGKVGLRVEVDSSEQKQRLGDQWQQRFLDKGGVSHLLHVLVSTDMLADALPLQQTSTQPSASCLSFHQSLALQCVMSLLAICTDVLRNPNIRQSRDQTTPQNESISSTVSSTDTTPSASPAPLSITVTPPAAASEQSDDVDMASELATKKRKEAAAAIDHPAKKYKPTDGNTATTTTANTAITSPSDDTTDRLEQTSSLFTSQLLSKLLSIMLHCAALPLYQPAPTVLAHSRSSDVLSSVLRAMDERLSEVAVELEQILPPLNVTSSTSVTATASPSYIDSPTTAIAELALPSPSPTTAISPLSPLYGPYFDPHRDEVSGVYSACVTLVQHAATQVSTTQLEPFVSAEAITALARTALLCSPRSCIRQCSNVLLLQLCYSTQPRPPSITATSTQPAPQTQYPLPQLMFALLMHLLTATPLSELQGRWRHQTEPAFAVLIRLAHDYLWCDVDIPAQPSTPPQQHSAQQSTQTQRVYPLAVLLTLFNLIQSLTAEREADATADQTAVGLLWLTALFVQLQHRIDAREPLAPPRLHGEQTSYPHDATQHNALAARIAQCGIIPFLYTQALFQVKPVHTAADLQSLATSPLFRFPSTRQAALELLTGLSLTSAANHTTLLGLSLLSHPHRADLVAASQYNYQPSLQRKPPSCPHVGLHNLGATCFPELDTRVLTNRGFLFLHEIEQCSEEVLYACYDVSSATIMYRPGKVVYAATPERWVEFTQSDTQRQWQCGSGDYGATTRELDGSCAINHLTLRTTPQHDMFVQPCVQGDDACQSHGPARKVRAEELTPGYQCNCSTTELCMHGWPSYRMFTGAPNGVQSAGADSLFDYTAHSPVAALGLRTEDELSAFFSLYGYWLNDGTMAYEQDNAFAVNAVSLPVLDKHDCNYLLQLLARLPLREGRDWTVSRATSVQIFNRHWFHFFDNEFGCMYHHSPHLDADLALHKQGVHRGQPLSQPLKSAKWLPDWLVHRLPKRFIRDMINGLRHSAVTDTRREICVSGITFRDQLVQACLHAGFSAYFTLHTHAGDITGYRSTSNAHTSIYTELEMKALLAINPALRFKPIVARDDSWSIVYSDSVSHILPASDIRFDGKPAIFHSQSHNGSGMSVAESTQPSDEYQPSDGRAWCVEVQHDDHLVFVQRAHTNKQGVVSKVGRVIIAGNCFPESDTRVLTNHGFLFLNEIEEKQRAQVQVLFGCYDKKERQLQYSVGKLVIPKQPPPHLVEFTEPNESGRWAEGSGPYGEDDRPEKKGKGERTRAVSRHVSLRVTPDHDMFVQTGSWARSSGVRWDETMGVEDPHRKLPAQSLLSDDSSACIRLLACAENGYEPHDTTRRAAAQVVLGLSDTQFAAFIELFGFWLGDGTIQYHSNGDCSGVDFRPANKSNLAWLKEMLSKAGLSKDDYVCYTENKLEQLRVTQPEWCLYYNAEFGSKYERSCYYTPPTPASHTRSLPSTPPSTSSSRRSSISSLLLDEVSCCLECENKLSASEYEYCTGCPEYISDESEEEVEGEEEDRSKSAKWLSDWLLAELSAAEMRLLIAGLFRAHGSFEGTGKSIFTSSASFRDQLMQALLHCGYTASTSVMCRAGTIRGYVLTPQSTNHNMCSAEHFIGLSPTQQSKYRPVKATADYWRVNWCDVTTKTGRYSCMPSMSRQQCITRVPYSRERDGRIWCVNVDHSDHLIIAQRAVRDNGTGIVTKQSRPIITSNCYMNSLMQQLYFTPPFRYGLFVQRHWDQLPRQSTDSSSSVIYQMQLLMAQLQESVQRFYDARSFCLAYRDYEGQCMALNTQMDVQEFANILFDQIEKELKQSNSHQLQLLNHVYGGKIVNQLICQQCGNRNERDEDYYMLSLDVKNKHSILNSLALYTDGELLEGDNKASCSRCNRKTETVKRVCVKSLPPHLILHLKRFEFDLDSMRKYKVNDYCEFPMELDLFPYTKEGIEAKERKDDDKYDSKEATPVQPPSYYHYTLSGVLVHTGTCNSGHYYSFVKDRTTDGGWWSCNDTNVEVLNVDTIKESCYGGGEMVNTYDVHTRKPVTNFVSKPYSAYMLFYDRVEMKGSDNTEAAMKDEMKAEVSMAMQVDNGATATATSPAATASAVDRDVLAVSPAAALPDLLSTEQAASLVPPLIFRSIWSDNAVFLSDCYIFDTPYFHFAYRLIKSGIDWWHSLSQQQKDDRLQRYRKDETVATTNYLIDQIGHPVGLPYEAFIQQQQRSQQPALSGERQLLLWSDDLLYHSGKFAIHFLLHTYAHARCKSVLEGWDGWLRQMMDSSYRLSCYLLSLLAVQRNWMRALVLLSGVQSFRIKWNDIILAAMIKCQAVYEERYDAAKQRSGDEFPVRGVHPYIADYMLVYLSLLPVDVQENIKNAHTYFSFLLAVLQTPNQPHFTELVLNHPKLITALLQFFLSSDSECPTTGVSYRRHPQLCWTYARDNTSLVAISQDTRVLMADGSAKIARLVQEGDVLVGEAGEDRKVEEVHSMDEEVDEDEEREVDEADDTATERKWRAFKVAGGDDYLLADLAVVRNDQDCPDIGDRPLAPGERDGERDENDEGEEEEIEEFDGGEGDVVPLEFWVEENTLLLKRPIGIPSHCIPHPRRPTLLEIHSSLRKMKPLRKKFSDKLKPFASFLATFLDLWWQRWHVSHRSFFPFLPFREARLLCHPELFTALLEMDANVSDTMFGLLCRNAPASVQLQVAQQLTDEIHKTAHSGLPHLFTLLYHFLAIDDGLAGMRVRQGVKKLVVVIRKNEKYKDEYSAMINLTANWIERKQAGGAVAGEPVMSDRVQLLLRDELVASVVQWDKSAIWSDVAPFRAAGLRLMLALSEWRSDIERRDEMLEQREDEFRAMRVKIARQEGRPVKLINGVLDVYSDDSKVDEQPIEPGTSFIHNSTMDYTYQAPPVTRPYTRIFTYVLSHLTTLLKRDRLAMERGHFFVETYELLDQLLTTFPSLIALVTEQHVQAIIDAMELTMKAQSRVDPMKSITTRLLYRLCTGRRLFVQLLTDSPTSRARGGESLASIYMYHDMGSAANTQYNELALTPVFQLLLLCCQTSVGFCVTLQNSPTFEWAVSTLLLSPPRDMYPSISDALLRLLSEMALCDESGDWRRRMLSKWWPRATVSRAHESQSIAAKQMENRLEPWIGVVERLARTNDDWKALGCSWFLLNVVSQLATDEHQKHSLQLHERVLALMTRMLLWYEVEQMNGNEAVVRIWNEVTCGTSVRRYIAEYLPAILCQVRVVKPPPAPQPAPTVAGSGKAVTRSTGKQVGGAMAAKNVKAATLPTIVPSTELLITSRRLLSMSPVLRLSSKALVDGLCVCQMLVETDMLDDLGFKTGLLKREQYAIDINHKPSTLNDNSTVYFGSLLPDIYYDGYQSICAHYYTLAKWAEVDDEDRAYREESAQDLLIFALEIAAAAPDTFTRAAVPDSRMMEQYPTWTTTELLKQAKRPTLYPATAVVQDPPPPALLVSPPTDSRLAIYFAILNSFGDTWRLLYTQTLSVQVARITCRRHRQLLLTPVVFHFVASVILCSNNDVRLCVDDPLVGLDRELRGMAENCIEVCEWDLLDRILLLVKMRWRQEAMREEIACEAADNSNGRYYEAAMDKLAELHEWLTKHIPTIEGMCGLAIEAEHEQHDEQKAEELPAEVQQLLDDDWLDSWRDESSSLQAEWNAGEKARRERVVAAVAEQRRIDDKDQDHYPLMLRFTLPAHIDKFGFHYYPNTQHINWPYHNTHDTFINIQHVLLDIALLHDRQQRIVQEMYAPNRAVKRWMPAELRRQRKEAMEQVVGPESESEEEGNIAVDEDEQLSEGSGAKVASDGGEEMEEEEKSEERK